MNAPMKLATQYGVQDERVLDNFKIWYQGSDYTWYDIPRLNVWNCLPDSSNLLEVFRRPFCRQSFNSTYTFNDYAYKGVLLGDSVARAIFDADDEGFFYWRDITV